MSTGPIVAGTDGSATARLAVDKAAELAQALQAPVHVVCVPGAIVGYEWPQRITAQEIVAKVAERLRGQGLTVETHLPKDEGDAGLTLVAVADSVQAQMIVVGNKGMTGLRRLLGSLPNTVSHRARCDVLIVPTQSGSLAEFGGGAIVVGTDGSSGATLAVKEAIRLAKALDGEVHVVSTTKSADSALSAAATEAADQGVSAATHALDGDAADALADAADEHDAVMIVLGTKGMHSDDRERFGNIADKISHKGTCSVMLVFTGDASDDSMSGAVARDAEV
jgi:nucleotide-binding universal stress UspA family protein